MSEKTRFIIVCFLILLSIASFSYCAFCYPKNNSCSPTFANPDTGQIASSNTEQNKPSQSAGKSRPRMGAT